ncbi:unnamed protein product [Phyllotreta striolata]|uniref:G patch domain-containing protein n=1 Tax=Phyllotreta striolata TaxID=444603 RepID=A0A9N9U041_PHYSR|nr:unnamed protein product [Phyllotreta striolata]
MSSEEEEENFCFFGKPLDPYDEDSIPKKRPISVEEQIATDAQGRRRFHGAFTGGFSAGFFNTVGSLEGWTPSDFKSSRVEKAKQFVQNPVDFMDQEDLGEYGIAPQTIRATKDYSTSKKRRRQVFSEGPIPGEPVLETLLTSGNETIGYLLLKKIGIRDKIKARDDEFTDTKTYGCQKPDQFKVPEVIKNKQYKIPAIYTDCLRSPKSNTFGLEYKGLEKTHVNLFASSNLVIRDKNDKKFSIGGQAFGVGAFEEDDDDIYVKEDMSNYDFELTKEKKTDQSRNKEVTLILGMFKRSNVPLIAKKSFPPPVIPHSFTGKHKVKKSRFEQIEVKTEPEVETSRNEINPAIRARYLGEEVPENYTSSKRALPSENDNKTKKRESNTDKNETKQSKTDSFMASLMEDKFVSASHQGDLDISEPDKKDEILHGTKDMRDAAKMKMYGPITRISVDWAPCSLLCKRFNVPEPSTEPQELKNRKRTKNLIFESQKTFDDTSALFKPGCSVPSTSIEEPPSNVTGTEDIVVVKTERTSPKPSESETSENTNKPETVFVDITDKIGVEENVDLFKAVFQSSDSESEEEQQEEEKQTEEQKKQNEDFKESILFDLVPKIRPLKQGILSNISFQPKQKTTDAIIEIENTESETSSYGPQLPSNSNILPTTSSKIAATNSNSNHSDDEWIEKDSKRERKKSKHKKDKKKKHKHKKSRDK